MAPTTPSSLQSDIDKVNKMMVEWRSSQSPPQAYQTTNTYARVMEEFQLQTLEEQAIQGVKQNPSKVGATIATVKGFGRRGQTLYASSVFDEASTPSMSGFTPWTTTYTPSMSGYTLSASVHTPSMSGYTPSISGYTPSVSAYTPSTSTYTPSISEYTPSLSAAPAQSSSSLIDIGTKAWTSAEDKFLLALIAYNYPWETAETGLGRSKAELNSRGQILIRGIDRLGEVCTS
jgi:hypothetical protein